MHYRKPLTKVQFQLTGKNHEFSPYQEIGGYVRFTPQQRISPAQLSLSFEGKTKVLVDRNHNNIPLPPARASLTFLHMIQPREEVSWQVSEELEVGTEYQLPFKFVVPAEILHHICRHDRRNEQIYHEHIQLPPSMGDPTGSSSGDSTLDYMLADTVSISYGVYLRAVKNTTERPTEPIGEWSLQVRIRPPRPEQSPRFITSDSKFYNMFQDVYLAKGLCQRRSGHLSAWTEQPKAIASGGSSTGIAIHLQLMALPGSSLPSICHIQLKLNAFTMYSPMPWYDFPDMTDPSSWDREKEYYRQTTTLEPPDVDPSMLEWRRCSIDKVNGFSKGSGSPVAYRAVLYLPINLAANWMFMPTFHSCLVSRIYTLEISICYKVKGSFRPPKITLTVPVQIL